MINRVSALLLLFCAHSAAGAEKLATTTGVPKQLQQRFGLEPGRRRIVVGVNADPAQRRQKICVEERLHLMRRVLQ